MRNYLINHRENKTIKQKTKRLAIQQKKGQSLVCLYVLGNYTTRSI